MTIQSKTTAKMLQYHCTVVKFHNSRLKSACKPKTSFNGHFKWLLSCTQLQTACQLTNHHMSIYLREPSGANPSNHGCFPSSLSQVIGSNRNVAQSEIGIFDAQQSQWNTKNIYQRKIKNTYSEWMKRQEYHMATKKLQRFWKCPKSKVPPGCYHLILH